jgi:hypothetical protein
MLHERMWTSFDSLAHCTPGLRRVIIETMIDYRTAAVRRMTITRKDRKEP